MIDKKPVVLMVEDDKDTIKLLRMSLLKSGFNNRVMEAHDGQEAIDYFLGSGKFANRLQYPLPQIVLLDLKMPRMSGIEFLKWFRNWPPGKLVPVVVMTTSVLPSDLATAYQVGANSYLIKGIDADQLREQMLGIGGIWLSERTRYAECPEELRSVG